MIITLCGSTRFKCDFENVQKELTLKRHVVISVGCFPHYDPDPRVHELKEMLDILHKEKILMAEAIFVVDVGGYVGSSTREEIEYARKKDRKVIWLEKPTDASLWKNEDEIYQIFLQKQKQNPD